MSTTPNPVSGSVHFFKIFGAPVFVVCSIVTTTRFALATMHGAVYSVVDTDTEAM